MPRGSRGTAGLMESACKNRKRGCSFSSSSSSILKSHKLKRAILVRRRGGSSTPVPTWKMSSSTLSSTALVEGHSSQNVFQKAKQFPVPARKLAATLWEMKDVLPLEQEREENLEKKMKKGKSSLSSRDRRSVVSGSLPPLLSDCPHGPAPETDGSGIGSLRRRLGTILQRYRYQGLGSLNPIEIETRSRGLMSTSWSIGLKNCINETDHCSSTYKDLFKILNRIWGLEEQNSTSMSFVCALQRELKRASIQMDRLVEKHRSDRHEIEYMKKRFAEEKSVWKRREEEKVRAAARAITADLDVERKLRKRMESLNRKLGGELEETRLFLARAVKELQNERKVRQVMEEVCNELARGIGEDMAKVGDLKRESAKVWEEVEREREMLQLADVWREERVQMKLADAKFQLEEKNAALDKLWSELEAFLESNRTTVRENQRMHSSGERQQAAGGTGAKDAIESDVGEEDSVDSDLHSIELSRDENCQSDKWGYASDDALEEDRDDLISHDLDRLKDSAFSEITEGIEWNLDFHEKIGNGLIDQGSPSESTGSDHSVNQVLIHDYDLEMQRYNHVKGLRDQVMAGAKIASASPTP